MEMRTTLRGSENFQRFISKKIKRPRESNAPQNIV